MLRVRRCLVKSIEIPPPTHDLDSGIGPVGRSEGDIGLDMVTGLANYPIYVAPTVAEARHRLRNAWSGETGGSEAIKSRHGRVYIASLGRTDLPVRYRAERRLVYRCAYAIPAAQDPDQ